MMRAGEGKAGPRPDGARQNAYAEFCVSKWRCTYGGHGLNLGPKLAQGEEPSGKITGSKGRSWKGTQ